MVNYGGDEVSALVLDPGSSSVRAGYAGDDTPRAIIPSDVGHRIDAINDDATLEDVPMADASDPGATLAEKERALAKKKAVLSRLFVNQIGPSMYRDGMEVTNPMKEGMVKDWETFSGLVTNAFPDIMRVNLDEHPVLVTEPPWNTPANRERMAEILFEEHRVPAFYIANTGVLNSFAAGKGTALVVDIGRQMASVTPVVDGFVLRKGLNYSSIPDYVHRFAHDLLVMQTQQRKGIDLLPQAFISNKQPVEPNADPRFTLRQDLYQKSTKTYRDWAEAREVDEWLQSVGGILDSGWNDQAALRHGTKQYEFATGYNTYFGPERYLIGEQFFNTNVGGSWARPQSPVPKALMDMLSAALKACDPELRQVLMSNVVVTGGGSLLSGFTERLAHELKGHFPYAKIHAPGNPIERRYGGWLGGSILGSLGSFHQLWISREEWEEHGKAIVGQRCK
ncbi:actin family [Schizophyllum amplum]|uniref:Actin family n=1 Tax=Schizophyllum amplum TaxID=97359 RepID=A0A550CUA9_9AGAR|nr:actin family [Auriculariopsis ampla]